MSSRDGFVPLAVSLVSTSALPLASLDAAPVDYTLVSISAVSRPGYGLEIFNPRDLTQMGVFAPHLNRRGGQIRVAQTRTRTGGVICRTGRRSSSCQPLTSACHSECGPARHSGFEHYRSRSSCSADLTHRSGDTVRDCGRLRHLSLHCLGISCTSCKVKYPLAPFQTGGGGMAGTAGRGIWFARRFIVSSFVVGRWLCVISPSLPGRLSGFLRAVREWACRGRSSRRVGRWRRLGGCRADAPGRR